MVAGSPAIALFHALPSREPAPEGVTTWQAARAAVPKQSERASERVSERKELVRLSAPALPRSLAPLLPCSLAPSVVVNRLTWSPRFIAHAKFAAYFFHGESLSE